MPDARPDIQLTPQGRPWRQVQSYSRRGGRFTPSQQEAWDAHADAWVVDDDEAARGAIASWFGREAPLVVEIGSGVGEATGVLAAARPDVNVLAIEVWRPGVAASLAEVATAGAANVRFCSVDAVWFLTERLASGELTELWSFFPDPWPKTRHHKRRLVQTDFAALVADRLAPGGWWRLATDWGEYAEQMREVLDAELLLIGDVVERWSERPVTKFERKGVAAGRAITDLAYRRRSDRSP